MYSRYGSTTHKQVYLYGSLDMSPTVLNRNYGMAWGIGGWLLTPYIEKIGPAGVSGTEGAGGPRNSKPPLPATIRRKSRWLKRCGRMSLPPTPSVPPARNT